MIFHIQNFQSIKDEVFEFDGLTSIVGPSDRGKSAIFRALQALFYNEWEDTYLRRGAKKCILTVEFKEGCMVRRIVKEKSASVNSYRISFSDDQEDKFYPKMGKSIPEEIIKLGFDIVETERGDKFNLNFQEQHDTLFLVSQSDVLVTSFFNKIFNVTRYENALRKITADSIKLNRQFEDNEIQILENNEKLSKAEEEHKNIFNKISILEALTKEYDVCKNSLELYNRVAKDFDNLNSLGMEIFRLQKESDFTNTLGKNINNYIEDLIEYIGMISMSANLVQNQYELNIIERDYNYSSQLNVALFEYIDIFLGYKDISKISQEYSEVDNFLIRYHSEYEIHRKLGEVMEMYTSGFNQICGVMDQIQAYNSLDYSIGSIDRELQSIIPVLDTFLHIIECKDGIIDIQDLVDHISTLEGSLSDIQKDIETNEVGKNEVDQYENYMRSIVKICPTCNALLS